jgi:hypothetical protein
MAAWRDDGGDTSSLDCNYYRNNQDDLGANPTVWPLLVFISRDLQEITSPIRTWYTDQLEHYLVSDCSTSGRVLIVYK